MRNIASAFAFIPIAALTLTACTGSPTAPGSSSTSTGIAWGSCDELVAQMTEFSEMVGVPSVLDGWEDRLQCGQIEVPLDYTEPSGRQITLAVSQLVPQEDPAGVVLTNPGGPGVEGRTLPAKIAGSAMADLARDHVLVGVDVRGTGGSTSVTCNSLLEVEAPDADVDAAVATAYAQQIATANADCVASDPEYFAQMTTQNAARDLDRVRAALGVEQTDYFGASWGTELGAAYLSQFPDRVEHMLLDSMTDLRQETAASLDDIAALIAAQGGADAQGDQDGLTAAPAYNPVDVTTRTAITCNSYTGASDVEQVWAAHAARAARLGVDVGDRTPHPVTADRAGTSVCAGWPLEPQPLNLPSGDHDNLQIVAHAQETVTPASWGQHAHELLGGSLTTLADAEHGSLAVGDAAASAVAFLRSGTPLP